MWCNPCRAVGMIHCAHPDECGNMLSHSAAADNWKAWLDDLPLDAGFAEAVGRVQDFISGTVARAEAAEAETATLRDRLARMEGERDDALSAARQQDRLREATLATLRGVSADLEASETKAARFLNALTPSADTKTAYMGEFSIPFPTVDENGNEVMLRPNVPWTTIKEIMAAIRARAALTDGGSNG